MHPFAQASFTLARYASSAAARVIAAGGAVDDGGDAPAVTPLLRVASAVAGGGRCSSGRHDGYVFCGQARQSLHSIIISFYYLEWQEGVCLGVCVERRRRRARRRLG